MSQVIFTGCDPGLAEPDVSSYPFTLFYDLSVPAEVTWLGHAQRNMW